MRKRIAILIPVMMSLGFISCGYRLAGTLKPLSPKIKRVYAPPFYQPSSTVQIGPIVEAMLKKEFLKKTGLIETFVRDDADCWLDGEILNLNLSPVSDQEKWKNIYLLNIFLNLKLIDLKANQIIFKTERFMFSEKLKRVENDFFNPANPAQMDVMIKFVRRALRALFRGD